MVVDQNFLKVKRTLVTIFLFTLFINYSFADNLRFKKIVNLKGPWGSTFISNTELLITEKSGEIKLIDLNTNKISSLNHLCFIDYLDYFFHAKHCQSPIRSRSRERSGFEIFQIGP